jgi:hypothetical protein
MDVKWSCLSAEMLANDTEKQAEFIQQVCDVLSNQQS